ncbi:MAG: BatA domain-containing protein [Chitinophagaceae bacterium]
MQLFLYFCEVSFIYPLFLIAGLGIAIPIIIHLFNFKKFKKVWFPDIRFLKELQEQTHKQSQLKKLLILASRIMALLALVAAFAQPFLNKDREKISNAPRAISIYIDNSFSMGIQQASLSMLDIAKGKAKELIESYGSEDIFQLLSNDFAYNENRFLTKEEALQHISKIQLSPKSKNANTILEKQFQLLQTEPSRQKQLVYISDFQKSNFPKNLIREDSIPKFFVSVHAPNQDNVSIDTAYLESPNLLLNEENILQVKLTNYSNQEINQTLTLSINEQPKTVVNTVLKAHEVKLEPIAFNIGKAGTQQLKVFINDYPLTYDDTFFVAGKVTANYSVLVINQQTSNPYLSSVFKPNLQFKIDNHTISSVASNTLSNYSLLILNGLQSIPLDKENALIKYVNEGGNLLVFAPNSTQSSGTNSLLQKLCGVSYGTLDTARSYISSYNKSHALFKDIFVKSPDNIELPSVSKHFHIQSSAMVSEQKMFSFSNGLSFLSSFQTQNGHVYVCASSADVTWSNFPKSYWFLPLLYKMAFSAKQHEMLATTLGNNAMVFINNTKMNDKTTYHISNNGEDAIPEQRVMNNKMMLNLNQAAQHAGIYAAYLPGSSDSQYVGVNYNRSESSTTFWSLNELEKNTKIKSATWLDNKASIASDINLLHSGMPLWKVCLILALIFLLIEILLIRRLN